MKAEIVDLDASVHQRVQKLLGFAGTLSGAELALVERHSAECAQCEADLAWMHKLGAVQPAAGAAPDMETALARLESQLGPRAERAAGAGRWMAPKWMTWALAAQMLVIAGLGVVLVGQQPAQDYRVLGAAQRAAPQANLLVMFQPGVSEPQLRMILRGQEAQVVGGPTEAGAWLLRVAPGRTQAAGEALRHNAAVRMAESLEKAP
ncbi:hypothetical protein E4L96_22945 [Massilia arenosa]|uniref:Zf-HC2 domain-containing protein n=1 Tax=Zemynaea arenosa TaxID=2561931 RepID=A0A4Y9RTU2_9BURK|nr:hypothetical protein [Massilia arenosa]TFW10678.1 hypothetical protein E4L96_22945 [Massilia arenosa]